MLLYLLQEYLYRKQRFRSGYTTAMYIVDWINEPGTDVYGQVSYQAFGGHTDEVTTRSPDMEVTASGGCLVISSHGKRIKSSADDASIILLPWCLSFFFHCRLVGNVQSLYTFLEFAFLIISCVDLSNFNLKIIKIINWYLLVRISHTWLPITLSLSSYVFTFLSMCIDFYISFRIST